MPKLTLKQSKKITISNDGQVLATISKKTKYGSVTTIHRISTPSKKMIETIEASHSNDNIFAMLDGGLKKKAIEVFSPKIHKLIKLDNTIDLTHL